MDSRYKVYFRVDGDAVIGMGHLVRSIALAEMLKEIAGLHFFCRFIPDGLEKTIRNAGMELTLLEQEQVFIDKVDPQAIVVLDGYQFDSAYQYQLQQKGALVICIDDMADMAFSADLIINHAPGMEAKYENAGSAELALGLHYALLRSSFLERAKHPVNSTIPGSLLICFGGSDPENKTQVALQAVLKNDRFDRVTVVTGPGYRHLPMLKELLDNRKVKYLSGIGEKEMLQCLSEAETVIVPCSGILLESLALQKQIISGIYIENQRMLYEHFKPLGAFIDAGTFSVKELEEALVGICETPEKTGQLIDGFSGERIETLFLRLMEKDRLILRKAVPEDLEQTYMWASDESIRANSFNRQKVTIDEHTNWFGKKIRDTLCLYLIAEMNSVAIGSVRFDIKEETAVISYLVDPGFQGKGYGKAILQSGMERLRKWGVYHEVPLKAVTGQVFVSNIPSVKVFESLNFVAHRHESTITFTTGF